MTAVLGTDAPARTDGGDSDAEVIRASLADPDRFGGIYDRHAEAVHRYLARRVGTAFADDLASETFLSAFRIRGRYDPERADARPWLYGIATNLLRRHRRTERSGYRAMARSGVDPLEAGEADDHADTVADRVTAAARAAETADALARLTAKERDVLLLFAWAELTYPEIAEALGIPLGTVRSRLNRARRRLRTALDHSTH
ncbi:RNA polymerase sigma factor [Kitasatospora sp. NPDC057198]|uniref:RNA polymerase sigma factor n=1 Tax=Kitasatospora sp. NPDC057198 TaxID=3346046 RepID=UPI0036441A66